MTDASKERERLLREALAKLPRAGIGWVPSWPDILRAYGDARERMGRIGELRNAIADMRDRMNDKDEILRCCEQRLRQFEAEEQHDG